MTAPKKTKNPIILELMESCIECTKKHLVQAGIKMLEYRKSDPEEYPLHPEWANGHLAEAEDEISCLDVDMAKRIRIERLRYLQDYNYQVPIEALVLAVRTLSKN